MEIVEAENNGRPTTAPNAAAPAPPLSLPAGKKKRSSSMNLQRIALFLVRGSSGRKKALTQYDEIVRSGKNKALFRTLLGSARRMHQLEHEGPAPKKTLVPVPEPGPAASVPHKETHFPPPSPCASEGWFSSDGMSRYASAEDLQALDHGFDEEVDVNASGSPYDIDLQAEEFIARFYQQMKLQRMDSFQKVVVTE